MASYDIKNQIESMFAKPASPFFDMNILKILLAMIIMKKMNLNICNQNICNQNIDNGEPTDNLYFLTSLKDNEITQRRL